MSGVEDKGFRLAPKFVDEGGRATAACVMSLMDGL